MSDVQMKGAVVKGRSAAVLKSMVVDVDKAMGQEAVNRVKKHLGSVLKNPTGYYQSRITSNVQGDRAVVTDSNVVYGPWLEGTGSRNTRSRFKGYRTFRLMSQQLGKDADRIASGPVKRGIARLG